MKKVNYILSICLVLILTVGSIAAIKMATATTTNIISTGDIDITLHDERADGTCFPSEGVLNVVPGETVDKVVYLTNTGSESEWVRIHIEKIISANLDVEKLKLNINETDWVYNADGWYYYNKVLKPNEKTSPLFTEVTFDDTMDNEYQNATAQIIVNAHGVQSANNDETDNVSGWPDTVDADSYIISASTIESSPPVTLVASTVKYVGQEVDGCFVYLPENTDMFQNFKGVMPGDTIAQDITIKNDLTDKAIKVYIYAEMPEVEDKKLLSNMAIAVFNGDVLLSDNNASLAGGLADKVLLGTIGADSKLTLTANLNVSINMGNEFKNQSGEIVWKFYIEEVEKDNPDIISPTTGDKSHLNLYIALCIMSLTAIIILTINLFYSEKCKRGV